MFILSVTPFAFFASLRENIYATVKAAKRKERTSVRRNKSIIVVQKLVTRFFLRQNDNNACLGMTKKVFALFAFLVSLCEITPKQL